MNGRTRNGDAILCPAVWYDDGKEYKDQPVNSGFVIGGFRHSHCYDTLGFIIDISLGEDLNDIATPGFLTIKNRFLDRREAAIIAWLANQINFPKIELASEDLY